MSRVREIRKIVKENRSISSTILAYAVDEQGFSIWTYRANDLDGSGDAPQNIFLDKKHAKILNDALSDFINSK